ncbi:hypothetical protein HMPREF0880_02656, partial [Yokenella regensburgei ATCC 43003]
ALAGAGRGLGEYIALAFLLSDIVGEFSRVYTHNQLTRWSSLPPV